MKKLVTTFLSALLATGMGLSVASAAGDTHSKEPHQLKWSFAGPFGTYDLQQLQRGLKVYTNVCAACHSLKYIAFRNLEALGYSEAQVKSFAAEYTIEDGPDDAGDMFERPGIPADYFPSPYPNVEAAAFANGGAAPPDLSLMAKARAAHRGFPRFVFDIFTMYAEGGPDYITALLTGYEEAPHDVHITEGTYYNPYFLAGNALAMAPPLSEGIVTYDDGTPETVEQYAKDVSAFLMWTAEPHMTERKSLGFKVIIFLLIFSGLLYLTKKAVWSRVDH
ncbi:MAG: ribosomal protein P2 [Rhizobiaceae bacterium MnEN-MB40S]|nr:MAG: ribosomal protein P2 [Rhizobiaceae bacterium MnEN-MB40S]